MLKMIFICALLLAPCVARSEATSTMEPVAAQTLQQIAWKVDYIGADYGKIVNDQGVVLDAQEYEEQIAFSTQATELAQKLSLSVAQKQVLFPLFNRLSAQIKQKSPPAQILETCQHIKHFLRNELGWKLTPPDLVSFAQATSLFQKRCASCHGKEGRADTPAAQQFKPPPASFHNAETMSGLSAELVYQTVTFGVEGTQMPSFGDLTSQERWNLAFYVLSLRHANTPPLPQPIPPWLAQMASLLTLSEQSDTVLLGQIAQHTPSPEKQAQALAYLRRNVPEKTDTLRSVLTPLRTTLQRVRTETEQGNTDQALYLLDEAYNKHFEPLEGTLRSQKPALVSNIEQLFSELRKHITAKAPLQELRQEANLLDRLIDDAEVTLGQSLGSGATSEVGLLRYTTWSLGLTLREGVEMALLIAFLLAFVRKAGRRDWVRFIHIGWISAVLLGIVTAVLALRVLTSFSGAQRELIEAVSTFLALLILLPLTHSILGGKEAKHWLGFLGRKLSRIQEPQGDARESNWGPKAILLWVSFFAVYREMVELILFYTPIVQAETAASVQGLILGILISLALLSGVVLFVAFTGKRLNPKPFMRISSVVMGLFCVVLAGQGVHALQEAGVLSYTKTPLAVFGVPIPTISWLGIYDRCWQGLLAQLWVLLILAVPFAVRAWNKKRKQAHHS